MEDKKRYYQGYTKNNGAYKEGTKVRELLDLAENASDFTEADIIERTDRMLDRFIRFLGVYDLLL